MCKFPIFASVIYFVPLWSENINCTILVLLNLLRFVYGLTNGLSWRMSHVQLMRIYFAVYMSIKATQNAGYLWMRGIWLGMGSQGAKGVVMLDISNLWWVHEHFIISLLDIHIYIYSLIYFTVKYVYSAMRLYCVNPMVCLQRIWLKDQDKPQAFWTFEVSGRKINVCYEHKSGFCTCLFHS